MDWTVAIFLGAVAVSVVLVVRTWSRNRALRGRQESPDGISSRDGNIWEVPGRRHDQDGQSDEGGGGDGGGGD